MYNNTTRATPRLYTTRRYSTFPRSSPPSQPKDTSTSTSSSASSFIAQQAQQEEEAELESEGGGRNKVLPIELREKGWDGEESRERMIKRILEDQYKPLRVKGYKKPTQKPSPLPTALFASSPNSSTRSTPTSTETKKEPLLPWEYDTTFRSPEHYNPSVAPGFRTPSLVQVIEESRGGDRSNHLTVNLVSGANEVKGKGKGGMKMDKETAGKVRLASAYERTLDYKATRGGGGAGKTERSNPYSKGVGIKVPMNYELAEEGNSAGDEGELMAGEMRVWEGFIEEKLKEARRKGLFKNIEGRGKPIPKDEADDNPFISRSDALLNRMMKSQDCAPPWIELQKELEGSLSTFRTNLSQNWIRRCVRIRSSEGLTPSIVREVDEGWRDPEWEEKEKKFHERSIFELNELTRKFNIIAPYHVRRPLLTLASELSRTITKSAPLISTELSRRLRLGLNTTPSTNPLPYYSDEDGDGVRNSTAEDQGGERKEVKESMWKAFRRVVVEVLGKGPDEVPSSQVKRQVVSQDSR